MTVLMGTKGCSVNAPRGSHSSMVARTKTARRTLLAGLMFYNLAQAQDAGYYKVPAFAPPAVARIEVDKSSKKVMRAQRKTAQVS